MRLTIQFPNGSKIYVAGAKDRSEIEKFRGWKLRRCYIDECQSFRSYIKELIDDIIVPALRDLRGDLLLTGTPGPVPVGPFYEYSHSDFWANFAWNAFDNPHMHNPPKKDLNVTLKEEREMKGIDETDPGYIRETYGKWVEDKDSLVFKFNRSKNECTDIPNKLTYIFGIDIGFEDSDAIAVLGYHHEQKKVYLVEESCQNRKGITELVSEINRLKSKYDPVKMVMDAGALGKKIQEEIRTRHQLHIEAADKNRKNEFIELLNDDLRTGKLQAFKGSIFAEDCFLVQWDRDSRLSNPEKPKVSNTYHSDICDAVLYAWRECKHFTAEAPDLPKNIDDYMERLEAKEAEAIKENSEDNFFNLEDDLFGDSF